MITRQDQRDFDDYPHARAFDYGHLGATEMAWTADDVVKVSREIGTLILSILAAIFAGLATFKAHDAKTVADTAEVRTQETEKRVEANSAEIRGIRPMVYGKDK